MRFRIMNTFSLKYIIETQFKLTTYIGSLQYKTKISSIKDKTEKASKGIAKLRITEF